MHNINMTDDDTKKQIRLASFGLILQVLDAVRNDYVGAYIVLPDGYKLPYDTAVAEVENSLQDLFTCPSV